MTNQTLKYAVHMKFQKESDPLVLRVEKLESTVKLFVDREQELTLRMTARNLERHVCLKAGPSKVDACNELFAFRKFDKAGKSDEIDKILQPLGLTREIFEKLQVGKRKFVCKCCYPMEVETILEFLDTYYEKSVAQQKEAFVSALRCFNMIKADGTVDFGKDPLA